MLIKTSDVVGLKVLTLDQGKKVENVDDVIYDPLSQKIQAVVVSSKGLFSSGQVILIEDIKSIGPDALVIQSADVLKKTGDVTERTKKIANGKTFLTNTTVTTQDGNDLGKITDLLFDPTTGNVEELEVSQGKLSTIQSGKKRIKPANILTVGEDAVIVSSYTEDAMIEQAQDGGLQGALNHAKDTVSQLAGAVKEKAQQTATHAQQTWQSPENQDKVHQAQQVVSEASSTAKDKLTNVGREAKDRLAAAQHSPENEQRMQRAQGQLSHAVNSATSAVNEVAQKIGTKETKVNEEMAIGQYVTQNIIDTSDRLIATRGTIVSHQLIAVAKSQGILDVVLKNVSQQPIPRT